MRPQKIKDRCTKKKLSKCEDITRTFDKIQKEIIQSQFAELILRKMTIIMPVVQKNPWK